MLKTPKTTRVKITRHNPLWPLDAVCEVAVPIPEDLARVSEPFHGYAHRVLQVDVEAHKQHMANDFRERKDPAPSPPKFMPVDDVCKEFWDGDVNMLDRAQAKYGFPKPTTWITGWLKNTPAFAERDLTRWTEEFAAFVRATKLDGK